MRRVALGLLAMSALSHPALAAETSAEDFIGAFDGRPQSAAQIRERCQRIVAKTDAMRVAFEQDKSPVSLETLRHYDDLWIVATGGNGTLYSQVSVDPEARKAGNECDVTIGAARTRVTLSRGVYDRLKAVAALKLDPATAFIVKREIIDLESSGAQLDDVGRARAQRLNEEIDKAAVAFEQAIADDKSTVTATRAELEGVPADYFESHKPGADGKYVLTLAYPDYFPAMIYAKDSAFRQRYYLAFNRRAYPANEGNLRTMIDKRAELAALLGRPNYATLVLADRMLATPQRVQSFLDELVASAKPAAQRDIARKLDALGQPGPLQVWDNFYASEIVKKTRYGFDSQEARAYFAFDKVQAGILKLSEDLFGVTVRRWDTPVWAKGVEAYEMLDGGKVIGRFYFDLHPRDGKYSHANAVPIRNGVAGRIVPVAALVMNVPGGDGTAGLMEHEDVVTFLHEYGHLLHYIFGSHGKNYSLRSGVATEWDFVEAPSQMLENWVYDYDTLKRFATDASGKPIPRDLVAKMERARYLDAGISDQRQSAVANASLGYYLGTAPADLGAAYRGFIQRYDPLPISPLNQGQDNLGHLAGYGPAYYTYLWSKVIADDLFSRFEKEGMRNAQTAGDYRRLVLEPGGEKPAAVLIEQFLGRPLSLAAHQATLDKAN